MVKIRISVCFTVLLTLILAVFGWSYKDSYTNVTSEPNYLDSMVVAEIPETFAIEDCNALLDSLPQAEYIFRVTPSGSYEQLFGIGQQKVVVQEVYSGGDVQQGQEIYITSRRWNLFLYDGEKSIERGYVNIMRSGADYLVFCTEIVEVENQDITVFRLYDESYIAPVFCYENIENKVIEPSGETTYVPYTSVADNEFFACTEATVNAWSELKDKMIELYPKSLSNH